MSRVASRLALLRDQTRAAHARIESVPAMARLVALDLTRSEYVEILRHMHGFHLAIEPVIAAALAHRPDAADLVDGTRSRLLSADLDWFGAAPMCHRPAVPCLATATAAVGALYVVEGSSLGARVIARHIGSSLGVSSGAGGSFYGWLSAEAARVRWARVCGLIERPPVAENGSHSAGADDADPTADDVVVYHAIDAFDCLEQWLRRIDVTTSARRLADAVAS